ncbi:hypothetical protein ACQEVB_11760 [Pseudonocardia sp. CA-107938]|uniref:hypothetical protein n=1 Tax=Pseudonocardia sp. CA-107938 TaxID=3240021 RepID=UPI003D8D180F
MPDNSPTSSVLAHGVDRVAAEYHMFLAIDPDHYDGDVADITNGLVGASADGVFVTTGVQMGPVSCEVSVRAEAPPDPTPEEMREWDEIVDVSFTSATGNLVVDAVDSETPVLPNLCGRGPGTYRVRVHARGRDSHAKDILDLGIEDVPEHYRLITWPSPVSPDTVHQTRDQFGQELRALS